MGAASSSSAGCCATGPRDGLADRRAVLFVPAFLGRRPGLTGWSYDEQDYIAFLQPPSADHWFGTTQIGEDVFAQTMRGLQKSLVIGLLVAVISTGSPRSSAPSPATSAAGSTGR